MVTRTNQFANLLAPGLRKVFFDYLKPMPTEYDRLFNVQNTERHYEDDYEMSMLGGSFPAKPEGISIQYVDPLTGTTKRHTPTPFGLGFRITHEMWKDDLYGPMRRMSQGLAKASHNTVELQAIGVIDDASAGATYTGFDALPLASTVHVILYTAGTFANRPTTYGVLGITTLQAALLRFEGTLDQDGVLCVIKPKLLFIPPALRFVAKEILGSEFKPYTANNEINPVKDEGLSYFVSHYMASVTMWGLIGDTNPLLFFWRERDIFDASDDFDTGDAKFKDYHRHIQGFSDWRGFDLGNT
jgi:hypothetical protein